MTAVTTVWEGPRLRRRSKKTFAGGYSRRPRRRTPIGLRRKTVSFAGELIGLWIDGLPIARRRGIEYRIFRTESGEILVHRVRWSAKTAANDGGKLFRFTDLGSAAKTFGSVLKQAGVI